jgi:hypothetical protein
MNASSDIAGFLKLPGKTEQNSNIKVLVQALLTQRDGRRWILIIDNTYNINILYKRNGKLWINGTSRLCLR